MAGVAMLLDLMRRNSHGSCASAKSLHPYGLLSATVAASAAAAAAGGRFAPRGVFGSPSIAFCDAGAEWTEEHIPGVEKAFEKFSLGKSSSEDTLWRGSLKYTAKEYPIEMKPLFSAFGLKSLAMTSVRSFLLFYLPLLEPRPSTEDDDDDFLQDAPQNEPVDLVVPFKKSLKQIARETSVVTTRRVLERLAVHYLSQRMAWKLLKDVPRSARRKALRGMPTMIFLGCVSRTTLRGHLLAVVASWTVQVGIDTYRCLFRRSDNLNEVTTAEKVHQLGKRIYSATVKCSASLVLASIGAGLFACLHPSMGQWIGCALGDLGGPIIVTVCCEKFLHLDI